jgi:hypothetical protein
MDGVQMEADHGSLRGQTYTATATTTAKPIVVHISKFSLSTSSPLKPVTNVMVSGVHVVVLIFLPIW